MIDEQQRRALRPGGNAALVVLAFGTAALLVGLGGGLASLLTRIRRLSIDVELDDKHDRLADRRR